MGRRDGCVLPTPETLAKLRPDPLLALIKTAGRPDATASLEAAADEIYAVFSAVVRASMRKGGLLEDRGGVPGVPPFLAWCHAQTYLPWARSQRRDVMAAAITLIVDRELIPATIALDVLASIEFYAKLRDDRPTWEGENE